MESREVENFHVRETTESIELGVMGKFINQTVDVSDRLVTLHGCLMKPGNLRPGSNINRGRGKRVSLT